MGDLTKNFSTSEFSRYRHGHFEIPSGLMPNLRRLAEQLQRIRDHVGRPVRVTSGYRTPAYNERIGGSKTSRHTACLAADIKVDGLLGAELAAKIVELDLEWDQVIAYSSSRGGHVHYGIAPEDKAPRGEKRYRGPGPGYPHVDDFDGLTE